MKKTNIPQQIPDNLHVFISHRSDDLSTREADDLRKRLVAEGIKVFLDIRQLEGGDQWDERLYEEVRSSDVLIIILNEDDSNWVRREVDLARGANISILPVRISPSIVNIEMLLRNLDLNTTQYTNYVSLAEYIARINADETHSTEVKVSLREGAPQKVESIYQELIQNIYKRANQTRDKQRKWALKLRNNRKRKKFRPAKSSYVKFQIKDTDYEIHIATGDIIDLKNIDVIVNSENTYMQMARRLDNNTLSSNLRHYGSEFDEFNNLLSDSVQDDLNRIIKTNRPVQIGAVFSTIGGHPNSRIVKRTNLKYIIHAATTQVNITRDNHYGFEGMGADDIPQLTKACLIEFDKLNQYEVNQDNPLVNIFFPVFNAGEVGVPISDILDHMIEGMMDYINDQPTTHLKHIHILAYTQNELNIIQAILENHESLILLKD
jgi:O-acetyl-ADP-ribose deacetylase (regulator of RNase III)